MAAIIAFENVSIHYSEKELFSGLSLTIAEGEKVGVIGPNGAGKSTLLKLAAQQERPDLGTVALKNGITLGYLSQTPELDDGKTITQQVLADVHSAFREADEYEAHTILSHLGFTDFDQPVAQLSGGQRKRVALAAVLMTPYDFLLLDEPTNHIDSEMVAWLEDRLQKYRGTLLMVTHDRYFLDRVCGRILEVADGTAYSYLTNYEGYLALKAERLEMADATRRKQQSLYKKELAWIMRGARARSTKAKGRIDKFESLKDTLSVQAEAGTLDMQSVASRLGKKIIGISHISKRYDDRVLFKDFSYVLLRDDRIGIVGENGAGKTTLLQILAGALAPDTGEVVRGETVRIGYFAQHCPAFPKETTVIQAVSQVAVKVYTPGGDLSASQMLEKFLFPMGCHNQQVCRLSGGEQRRLYLLQVLMAAPNVLFLDEPTNDLDIDTLTILEDYLDSFPGAVISVSHDRYFLDRTVRRVFAFENEQLAQYEGGYTDYKEKSGALPPKEAADKPRVEKAVREPQERAKTKFTFKEQRDFETIEDRVSELEAAVEDIKKQMEANSSDYQKVTELTALQEQKEGELEQAMERWMYLQELNEQFQKGD